MTETVNNSDDVLNAFQQVQNKNEVAEVLKELFDEKKIFLIGDLTKDEIKIATRIFMISELKNIQVWEKGLAFYCKILLSKDRRSRREILDAIRGYSQGGSFMGKFNPKNWFNH